MKNANAKPIKEKAKIRHLGNHRGKGKFRWMGWAQDGIEVMMPALVLPETGGWLEQPCMRPPTSHVWCHTLI